LETSYRSDFRHVSRANQIASKAILSPWKRYWTFPAFALLGLFLGWGFGTGNRLLEPYLPESLSLFFLAILVVAIMVFASRAVRRLSLGMVARAVHKRSPPADVQFVFDGAQLSWTTEDARTIVDAKGLYQIGADGELLVFLTGPGVLYVPMAAFASKDEAASLLRAVYVAMTPVAQERSRLDRRFGAYFR